MAIKALFFSAKALQKMLAYVDGVDTEIGWIGKIERDQFDIPFVSDVKLLKQEVTAATVMITVDMMDDFFDSLPDAKERAKWCLNGHSHVNMATSPSGVDINNYNGYTDMFDTFVPIIVNKKREFTAWAYHSFPMHTISSLSAAWVYEFRHHFDKFKPMLTTAASYMQISESLIEMAGLQLTAEERAEIQEDIKANVSEKKYQSYTRTGTTYLPPLTNTRTPHGGTTGDTKKNSPVAPNVINNVVGNDKPFRVGNSNKEDRLTVNCPTCQKKNTLNVVSVAAGTNYSCHACDGELTRGGKYLPGVLIPESSFDLKLDINEFDDCKECMLGILRWHGPASLKCSHCQAVHYPTALENDIDIVFEDEDDEDIQLDAEQMKTVHEFALSLNLRWDARSEMFIDRQYEGDEYTPAELWQMLERNFIQDDSTELRVYQEPKQQLVLATTTPAAQN